MTVLDVCAYLGLAAVGTATLNMLLGLLIAVRYSPVRLWPHRRINIFQLHNWTAYLVLLLIVLHPAFVLMFFHSVFTDPTLSNGKIDPLDGGKVFVDICGAITVAAWTYRIRLRGRGFRQERALIVLGK